MDWLWIIRLKIHNYIDKTRAYYLSITWSSTFDEYAKDFIVTAYLNDKTKKDVAKTVVRAVERIYKDLHGDEKLDKALASASEMLAEKGITVTDLEMRMLIESVVAEFNKAFEKKTEVDEISSESGITE